VKPTVNSSVKPSHEQNDSLIERTLEVWAPRLGCDLSGEDARQIAENMVGFFKILNEWRIGEATCSIGFQPRYDWHDSGTCIYHRSYAGAVQDVTAER
jgi:L-fucose isomerase-like protein